MPTTRLSFLLAAALAICQEAMKEQIQTEKRQVKATLRQTQAEIERVSFRCATVSFAPFPLLLLRHPFVFLPPPPSVERDAHTKHLKHVAVVKPLLRCSAVTVIAAAAAVAAAFPCRRRKSC